VRYFDSLTKKNIIRSDNTYKRIRRLLYPNMPVPADDVGPLATARANRPGARAAWKAAAKMNAQRALATRGRRMMAEDGKACHSDEEARKYAGEYLRKLAGAARLKNTVALALFKDDGAPDLMTYSLGGGGAYVRRFRGASETQKEEWRVLIRKAARDARVKGAKESKAVVLTRVTEMKLGDDGLMMYRLGASLCLVSFSQKTH